jgi:glycosyltransferase involved in cell wall biosynthesis
MSVRGPEAAGHHLPKLDVLLIGPYPPPLGGISAHVARLAAILVARGLRVGVLNHFGGRGAYPVVEALHRNPILYTLALRSRVASVVHYHHSSIAGFFAVALTPRRRGTAYLATIHGHDLKPYLESRITAMARATRWALRRFDHVVAVSPEVEDTLCRHLDAARVTVAPAYLPVEEEGPQPGVPAEVRSLVAGSSKTLVVSAYRITMQGRHEDVYGLDVAVETFARLAHRHSDLRLGIFLAHPPRRRKAKRFLGEMLERTRREGLEDRTAVIVGESLAPVFAHDVIYLRPSRTDGDAVSIREALDAGVRVLASDAILRPSGTQVLPTGDVDAWCEAVERELQPGPSENGRGDRRRRPSMAPPGPPTHGSELLALYGQYLPAAIASRCLHETGSAGNRVWASSHDGSDGEQFLGSTPRR